MNVSNRHMRLLLPMAFTFKRQTKSLYMLFVLAWFMHPLSDNDC